MVHQSATVYFCRLSELFLLMQVTDQQGIALSLDAGASRAVEMILSVRAAGRKMLLIGNGGSAAIVSHMQNDLCKVVGVRAMVFQDAPLLTALGNDHGYGSVFARPLELWADTADLLLAISSSGQSDNILRGVQTSAARGCRLITFSGFAADNPLRQMGDLNFYVPSGAYGVVEVAHAALAHFLTDCASIAVLEGQG